METKIKCKYCGREIEISEALRHEVQEKILKAERKKFERELEEVEKKAEEKALARLQKDFELQIKNLQKERQEERERNTKLLKQLESLNDEMRKLRRRDEERELEMKKQLAGEEEKIRSDARKKVEEENELKFSEYKKKLADTEKALMEAQRKAQQGSQQTQGEVLELDLEKILRKEFPDDEIIEVKKGQRGADIVQKVIDKKGRSCGTILWEIKNAKWSKPWLATLKNNQRQAKADHAVLATANPPEHIETFSYESGVWITHRKFAVGLALALRFDLIHLHNEKLKSVGKKEKMEILYQYLVGTEFKHRIEAIAEGFTNLQEDIEREKRWFNSKWARQEKEIRKIVDSTYGMCGDLEAVTGQSLKTITTLELPEPDK